MKLILIRHAESEHARQGLIADVLGCRGLTVQGVQQAEQLAMRLRTTGEANDCSVLLSSPVPRARQTAQILQSALPVEGIHEASDLCEIRPDAAGGLSNAAYQARFGAFDPVAEPQRPFAPGGESWSHFVTRVDTTLERLAVQYPDQTVVAVTHAGFIVVAFLCLFAIPRPGTGTSIDPCHTSLTIWHCRSSSWQLERYNDAWHLDIPLRG